MVSVKLIRNSNLLNGPKVKFVDEVLCIVVRKDAINVSTGPFGLKFKQYTVVFRDMESNDLTVNVKNKKLFNALEIGKKGILKRSGNDLIDFDFL